MTKPDKSFSFAPDELAQLLSDSARKFVTPEQVAEIVETGNLLSADGTVDLHQYMAFLIGAISSDE